MTRTDSPTVDAMVVRAERMLALMVAVAVLLLAVFALGMSGLPGDVFGALLDWAISRGVLDPAAPAVQAASLLL